MVFAHAAQMFMALFIMFFAAKAAGVGLAVLVVLLISSIACYRSVFAKAERANPRYFTYTTYRIVVRMWFQNAKE